MSAGILLKNEDPKVELDKIGISYAGGGPLVLIELGIARAFVELGIVPAVIAGASAGAIAGTAHALDVRNGTGIDLAIDILGRVSNRFLGLTHLSIFWRILRHWTHTASLGDNQPLGRLIRDGLGRSLGLRKVTIGTFAGPTYPTLMLVATDVTNGRAIWFASDGPSDMPLDTPIEDALLVSSAIPGVFPWRTLTVGGAAVIAVDGGVVSNQPLSKLAQHGCGTIYACSVGPVGPFPPPKNGVDNALNSVQRMMHQSMKLEEEFVRVKLEGRGIIHHIHPEMDFTGHGFDFTPDLIETVVGEACEKTKAWQGEEHGE